MSENKKLINDKTEDIFYELLKKKFIKIDNYDTSKPINLLEEKKNYNGGHGDHFIGDFKSSDIDSQISETF